MESQRSLLQNSEQSSVRDLGSSSSQSPLFYNRARSPNFLSPALSAISNTSPRLHFISSIRENDEEIIDNDEIKRKKWKPNKVVADMKVVNRRLENTNKTIRRLEKEKEEWEKTKKELSISLTRIRMVEKENVSLQTQLEEVEEITQTKTHDINSLQAKIVQNNQCLNDSKKKNEDLSARVLELEKNASNNSLNLSLAAEKSKYTELKKKFEDLKSQSLQNTL